MAGDTTPDGGPVDGAEESSGFATCTNCGRVIPSHRMLCSMCLSERETETLDPEIGPAAAPRIDQERPYRPPGTLAIVLRMIFAAWVVIEAFAIGSLYVLYRILDDQVRNPFAHAFETMERQIDIWDGLAMTETIFSIAIAVLFIAWLFRAYGNVPALGTPNPQFVRGWAIGGFFLPVANAIIPKLISDEVWRSSDPAIASDTPWGKRGVDWRVHVWWVALVLGRIVFWVADQRIGSETTLEGVREGTGLAALAAVLLVISAILAVWFVSTASARQTSLARDSGRFVTDRDPTRGLNLQLILMVVATIVIAFIGYLVFRVDEDTSRLVGEGDDGGPHQFSNFGISFEYPPKYTAVEMGIIGDEAFEEAGMVAMINVGDPDEGSFVYWTVIPASYADFEWTVDDMIESVGYESGDDSLVVLSDAIPLEEGPTQTFVAKTFRMDTPFGFVSGAAAAGRCADSDREIALLHVDDWVAQIDAAGTEADSPYVANLREILATLDC